MSKSPFDYVKAINSKNYNFEPEDEKNYQSFIVNKAFAYFPDTILHAAQMNLYPYLDNKLKYDYLYHAIRKKARFSKWDKRTKDEDLQVIMNYYKYSLSKAKQVLSILTPEQIKELQQKLDPGGVK